MATSRAMPTPFYLSIIKFVSFAFWALGFHVYIYIIQYYMSLIIASCTQKISFQNTVKPLNNMHADTLGAGPLSLL